MKTITSLKDLIQKLSNDEDFNFSRFSTMLDLWLSGLGDSTKVSRINYYYGCIYGSIETLYYGDYITETEKDSLCNELKKTLRTAVMNCLFPILPNVQRKVIDYVV